MRWRSGPLVVLIALVVLGTAGIGSAASSAVQLRANLHAAPNQQVRTPNASARFNGSLVRTSTQNTLSWRLIYSKLSSAPTLAYIFMPKSGNIGAVVIDLCRRHHCKSGMVGSLRLPANISRALARRKGYAVIRTQKNPKGEIQGLLVRTG